MRGEGKKITCVFLSSVMWSEWGEEEEKAMRGEGKWYVLNLQ